MAPGPEITVSRRRVMRWTGRGVLLLFLLPLLLGATPPGLWLCAKSASGLVSAFTPYILHVSGLTGMLPFSLHIDRVELLDRAGPWLTVENLAVRARAKELLTGHFHVQDLSSTGVRWERRPIQEKRWRIPQIPGLRFYPAVDNVSITTLTLGREVIGRPLAVAVTGRIERAPSGGGQKIVLAARRTDGRTGSLNLAYEQDGQAPAIQAHLDDDDILPFWLGLDSALVINLSGSGNRKNWNGTLQGTNAAQRILDGKIQFSGEFPTVIKASLDTNIATSRRLQALNRFLGPDTHLSLDALLAKSGQLDILDFSASSPRGVLQGAGQAHLSEKHFGVAFQGCHADLGLLSCREEGTGLYVPADISALVWGDTSSFQVRVLASSRALPLFESETTVIPGPRVKIDGAATVFMAPLTGNGGAGGSFGESAAVAWSGEYDAPGILTLKSIAVDHPAVQMSASGSVLFPSTTANFEYAGMFNIGRIPALAAYSHSGQPVPFTGTLTDDLSSPTLSLDACRVDLDVNGVQLKEGRVSIGFHLDQTDTRRAIRDGSLRVESPHCGYRDYSGLLSTCTARFESDDLDRFRLRDIALTVPTIAARFTAEALFDRVVGSVNLKGRLHVDDIAATAVLYPHPLSGALAGTLHLDKKKSTDPVRIGADFDWDHPSGFPESFALAVGDKVHAVAHIESGQSRITLQDARLDLEAGAITASGWQDKDDHSFKLLLGTKAAKLAKVSTAKSFDGMRGSVDLGCRVEGTPDDFSLSGDARVNDFSWDRIAIRSTKLKFSAGHLPGNPEGNVTLNSSNGKQGLSLDGSLVYRVHERQLHVEKARFSSSKNRLDGGLDFGLDSGEFSANADFAFPALKDLSSLLGVDLSGTAQGKIAAVKKGDTLGLTLQAKAAKVETPWGSIASMDAKGSIIDLFKKPRGDAKIAAADFSRNGLQLSRTEVTLSGDGVSAAAKANIAGRYQKNESEKSLPFTMQTVARASLQSQDMTIAEVSGNMADISFSLAGPGHLYRSGADYALDNVAFHVGTGGGELSFHSSPSEIRAACSWKDIPLAVASLAGLDRLAGNSSGSLQVDGPPQAPAVRVEMQVEKVRNTAAEHGPGLDASLKAVHEGQWTSADLTATLSDAAKASVSVRIPVNLSMYPPLFLLRVDDPLQAEADVSVDLSSTAGLMEWTNDLPRGSVTGKFRLGGTIATPRLSGELKLQDGGYENLRYGAVIKNLRARLVADGNTVRVAEFSGTDGEDGILSGTGQMEVSFAKNHPFQADVTLERMRSLHTEYGTAVLSGKLRCSGSMADAKLSGNITVQEGDFRLAERLNAAKIADVEFTEKNAPKEARLPAPTTVPVPAFPAMAMDVAVSIPGRFFLRAPVLETEWKGDMQLRGTMREPRTEGTLTVTRGHLDLIGQRFSLADSTVGFLKGDIKSPYLNMTGVCVASDITARIQVSGPPSDAQLTLSSDPALPQDEILSKLLFRKGVSQASPLQAIQVARTAAMFSDRLSLPQFLTGSVTLPGLDRFDIRTGEKVDKTVVGVGKYINDKIYVEAEQGPSTDSGRVSAQVEVTPRVSVKADVGAKNRGGVGIMWKKDY